MCFVVPRTLILFFFIGNPYYLRNGNRSSNGICNANSPIRHPSRRRYPEVIVVVMVVEVVIVVVVEVLMVQILCVVVEVLVEMMVEVKEVVVVVAALKENVRRKDSGLGGGHVAICQQRGGGCARRALAPRAPQEGLRVGPPDGHGQALEHLLQNLVLVLCFADGCR
jgi:hypothetical protein